MNQRELNQYLKNWMDDINHQTTAAGRKEARFSFIKKFKRDFKPQRTAHIKSGYMVLNVFNVNGVFVHIDINKKIDRVTFYVIS